MYVCIPITENRVFIKKSGAHPDYPNVRLLHIKKLRARLSDCYVLNDSTPV